MKAAIIDDLCQCRIEVKDCLNRYLDENYAGERPIIHEFESGEDFLSRFMPETYDIIFIDQYMDGLSGMDTAEKIREKDELVALVFVTTSLDHAIESFDVRACGYLVKPFTYEKFKKVLDRARLIKIRSARFIRMEQSKILLREILWCDRDEHYVQIHTIKRGVLRFRISFAELTEALFPHPQFVTCYKSCIVNLEHVERIDGLSLLLDTGDKVQFSAQKNKEMITLFDEYTFRREREDELE